MRTAPVRALQRGLSILEYLNRWDGATIKEIAEVLGTPHATTYRLLKTLCDHNLLTKGNDRGEYWLAAGVKALSAGYRTEAWLVDAAVPVIEALAAELHWPTALMLPRGDEMVVKATNVAPCPNIKGKIPTGMVSKFTETAGGLVYLAHLTDADHTPPSQAPALRRKLAAIGRDGYATLDEDKNDVIQIAVPVRTLDGARGALMSRADRRVCPDTESRSKIARRLVQAADRIAAHIPALSSDHERNTADYPSAQSGNASA